MNSSNTEPVHVCCADYANPKHAAAVLSVLDAYARDPMGGGEGLTDYAKKNLISSLMARPQAFSILAFDQTDDQRAIGLVNCLEGFSTFACRPLVNVHDVAVLDGYRGHRVAEKMLALAEKVARQRGACKLTLEVLEGNAPAIKLYSRIGFASYQLGATMGNAQFLQKWLK